MPIPKGYKFSKERNEKISKANKGKVRSKASIRRMSMALKGRKAWNKGLSGYKNKSGGSSDGRFKDWDGLGYEGKHNRMKKIIPKPARCQRCGGEKSKVLSNKDHQYRNDPNDWWWLCNICHFEHDHGSDHSRSVRGERGRFINKTNLGA